MAGIMILAAITCGLGGVIGVAIGKVDDIPNSSAFLAVLGILSLSIAVLFLLPNSWRKQWAASLPFFWLTLGGPLIAEAYFGVEYSLALPITLAIALPCGPTIGGRLATLLGFDKQSTT